MTEHQSGVSYELPDDRLRAVEVGLAVLAGKVEDVRADVKEGFANMGLDGRLKSCPHNEDFVRVLGALEAGGKRFNDLESALTEAVAARSTITTEHAKRIKVLEDDWSSAKTSVKTAKWVVGFFGLMVGWMFNELLPVLEKLLNISK
ncbi:MAG: hypothetical protein M0R37_10525 [Bacteroidales bacterium]|nr:hypothetical protein [Bacteroidales bacterium]